MFFYDFGIVILRKYWNEITIAERFNIAHTTISQRLKRFNEESRCLGPSRVDRKKYFGSRHDIADSNFL